jgi:hypothetical protein
MSWAEERPGSEAAGVERRGIYDLNQLTAANRAVDVETEHSTVTHWTTSSRGERAKSHPVQEPNDRSPPGAQDGDRRLRRDQHRSPARGWRLAACARWIRKASTEGSPLLAPATVCLAEDEHPVRKFVERGFVEATPAARWGIRRNLGT